MKNQYSRATCGALAIASLATLVASPAASAATAGDRATEGAVSAADRATYADGYRRIGVSGSAEQSEGSPSARLYEGSEVTRKAFSGIPGTEGYVLGVCGTNCAKMRMTIITPS